MNYLRKSLLILLVLIAFGPTTWTQFSSGIGTIIPNSRNGWRHRRMYLHSLGLHCNRLFLHTEYIVISTCDGCENI